MDWLELLFFLLFVDFDDVIIVVVELVVGDLSGGGYEVKSKVKGFWFMEEDVVFMKFVSKLGLRNWSLIVCGIFGCFGKLCWLCWCN